MVRIFFNPDIIGPMPAITDIKEENLQYIASVEVDSLEAALEIGQNNDQAWTEHPLVKPLDTIVSGTRSISVGDVLEKEGEWFVVMQSGFEKI